MKHTLSTGEITVTLLQDKNAGWTIEGAKALAEHIEKAEAEKGIEIEIDLAGIRGDFAEYETATEACIDLDLLNDLEKRIDKEREIEPRLTNADQETLAMDILRIHVDRIIPTATGGIIVGSW